ncbi:hypothetical protein AVEN_119108-1 [Araneus ventricosus]|uniref:DUF659 domain-containing protein n=1 Tax=Araneus ventricosus TaxID=182803 RepID=A0A4Y2BKX7_ARAVE|nr:hypothetical protein AVEN_119108-1 [Araneus ventricosus]
MVPIAAALGEDASSLSISRSTVHRVRKKARSEFVDVVAKNYAPKHPITIHWNSKILRDIMGIEIVDRLPVIVSGDGEEKLLGVPKLQSGTGKNAAEAIYKILEQWDLVNQVIAMSVDTTSVNTGHLNGTCTLLEDTIGRDLLWLSCRHHTLELIPAKVFTLCFGPSSSPEIPLFKRFKKVWHGIERNNFQILEVTPELVSFKESALSSLSNLLNETVKIPRDDYQELIELTNTVLGKPPEKIHWQAPGPVHHARRMSKLIYGIKIYLYRNQKDVVNLTKREETQLEKFVKFGALIYTKVWIAAPLASEALFIDLKPWKDLKEYELFDFKISNAAKCILVRHLWYLSDELVRFALFSDIVLSPEKDDMAKMIKSKPDLRKVRGNCNILKTNQEVNLSDFVTERSGNVFQKLNIADAFLNLPSEEWKQNSSYLQGRERVRKSQVVNDTAERGVKLFQEFNSLIIKGEEEKQFLLQAVEANRKTVPSKSTKKHVFDATLK